MLGTSRCCPSGTTSRCASGTARTARGERPNVRAQPLDLQPDEFVDLHRLLPTVNFRPPAPGEPSKRTVVLIAERDLRDEELWLDYKLNPDGPLESWYAPVLPARAGGDE